MNARFGFPSPAVALVAIGCLVSPASEGSMANGGFESGLDGWTWGGSVTVESEAPYAPTEGSKLVAFSAENLAPDGWISQTVDIPNSIGRYHRLRFDVGNLGYISAEVRLRIEITEIGYGAPVPRVNEVITVPGINGGATRWQQAAYDFPTPITGQVLVKLTDVSPETNSTDLVVDNLRIDDSIRVGVTSSDDWPNPGIDVSVSPASIEGWTTSHTPATFNHHGGTTLTLTAPAFTNLKPFVLWRKNGVDYDHNPVTTVILDEDTSMVAVYDPPLALHLNSPAEARGFAGTGPFDQLSWSGYIQNGTGAAENWSASAVLPDGSTDPVFFKVIPSHGRLETYNSATLRICLTAEALKLPAGTHYGRVDVSSRFSTAATGIVLTVIDPNQHVENGSFESDFDHCWSPLYHITLESGPPYTATDGSKLIAFNAHETTPNGVLTHTIPTEANVSYTLTFDVGTLSYNTQEQRLEVGIANAAEPPFHIQTEILYGAGDGTCHWESRQLSFVAHGDSTTISFRDVSTATNSIDLLLDHVRVSNPGFGLTVTTLADENDATLGSGTGDSLREVIAQANFSPGTNAITFSPALDNGLITLNGSQLSTNLPLAIDASALPSGIAISGASQSRVIELGADAAMQNLRIMGGNTPTDQSGGGIFNHGNLLLAGVTVSNNRSSAAAAGILNTGTLCATNCRLADNFAMSDGAALGNEGGTTLLENSVVSGNLAFGNGSGLTCRGSFGSAWIILSGSTVSNNAAGGSGGGYSGLTGYKLTGTLYGENSTFSGNTSDAAGGAIYGNGMVDLTHCTVSQNTSATEGGGIAGAWLHIGNSIVAGNTAPASPDLVGTTVSPEAQNLLSGNPALSPLGDYGGPTLTMLPSVNSPAINGGLPIPEAPATDQRGSARTSASAPDLGAVEIQEIIVNTLADENDGPQTGAISLRDAITTIQPTAPDIIRFHPLLNGGTITLAHGELALDSSRSIDASNLPAGLTVSANHASRVMTISNHAVVGINSLTFTDGLSSEDGGGLKAIDLADVTLNHCTIRDNNTTTNGGGIHTGGAWLHLDHSSVTGNHAAGDGGGIHAAMFTETDLLGSWIDHNTCGNSGGGIFNGGWLDITRSTISNNHCSAFGGGIITIGPYAPYKYGKIAIETSTLTGNSSDNAGGAIAFYGSLPIRNSTITGNTAANTGGAIFLTDGWGGGSLSLANSILTENQAPTAPDTSTAPSELLGNNLLTGNPALAPLADFGGATPTMPPLPGSPVIDAAVMLPETPATDQRGCPRPFGPLPDIGAVEATPFCQMELVDSDNDKIDDRLEPAYQMTIGIDDSGRDSDGDGSSDADELANMTDPFNSSSLLRILSFTKAPDFDAVTNPVFDISFASFPGLSYSVECDQNLDFTSPATRFRPLGTAGDFTGSARVTLAPDRDFVRVRRDP